jgi:hypothetical protein
MANQAQKPGPERARATGFDELRKEVAHCNEQAQKKHRKIRDARDRARILARREGSAL